LKQITISIQGVELGVDAASISDAGQAEPIPERTDQRFLLLTALAHFLVSNQAVRNFGKCRLDVSLVLNECPSPLGLREFHVGLDTASGENRLCQLRRQVP